MKNDQIEKLIQYRLEQARESITEAKTLLDTNLLRGAINRAYYAMFYAALALAVLRQKPTSKHSSLIAYFDQEFIKTEVFPRELSRSFHRAFQRRQENDYGEMFSVNEVETRQAIRDARDFVDQVENYIRSSHQG